MAVTEEQLKTLKDKARRIRIDILKMLTECGSGHTGGSLSAADIATALYFYKMKYDPKKPDWKGRDNFILSKGHAAPLLYTVLAHAGFLRDRRALHAPEARLPAPGPPGQQVSSGRRDLDGLARPGPVRGERPRARAQAGQGAEPRVCAAGRRRTAGRPDLGSGHDRGPLQAGQPLRLVDNNGLQIDGPVAKVMGVEPITDKWRAFGWEVLDIDGHDMAQIVAALDKAETVKGKPTMIVCRTVKGKGSKCFEGKVEFHGTTPSKEELAIALKELRSGV